MIFEGPGRKQDYNDPMYGPCSRIISDCPSCGAESAEFRKPKPAKNNSSPQDSCPAYHSGGCSCCH
ncbi:MAG: hypothetical protein A2X22_11485 [Bacteroidetes bacterium GWF2_49_14]|nr:MAG: hypothetical protein A2X22_11485 [Bacteroidetes bacterium GWF2_49_14]HBB90332.1 hypothetical protein [Bacteroidales bacterium]